MYLADGIGDVEGTMPREKYEDMTDEELMTCSPDTFLAWIERDRIEHKGELTSDAMRVIRSRVERGCMVCRKG